MTIPNPCESPAVQSAELQRPSGAILPAVGCLVCTVLAMYSGKLCWWAMWYRMDNTGFLAKLPEPSIPLWIIDCVFAASLAGTILFIGFWFAAAYRTVQRMLFPFER